MPSTVDAADASPVQSGGTKFDGRMSTHIRKLALLPPSPPSGQVAYSTPLVTYVVSLFVASLIIAATSIHATSDPWPLALSVFAIACLSGYAVRSVGAIPTAWSAGFFIHIGVAIVYGPLGACLTAATDALATSARHKIGWFRCAFNWADQFLTNVAAWEVHSAIARGHGFDLTFASAGLAAGIVAYGVNNGLILVVIRLATHAPYLSIMTGFLGYLPYAIGYGWASMAFVVMYRAAGFIGVSAVLTPVVLLQVFLIVLARRVFAHDQETKQHQEARVRLLQRAIDASNAERERVASDIHDGVVQDLVGLAFSLGAYSEMRPSEISESNSEKIMSLIKEAAETSRNATRDLRTLIIEIAPPKLKQQGLRAALADLLNNIGSQSKSYLDMPASCDSLDESQQGLIYRVAQEAVRNSTKYSAADHVEITLVELDGEIHLGVFDDGKGFSLEERDRQESAGHAGLSLLARTVQDGGGSLSIVSAPGEGTRVNLRVKRHPPPVE